MTTTATRTAACTHAAAACCWLCSDLRPWWKEARLRAGYGAEPPNAAWQEYKRFKRAQR